MSLKKNLNKDRINKQLVFLMKIEFNPDKISNQKSLDLNKNNVTPSPSVKHLCMLLDSCLNVYKHV